MQIGVTLQPKINYWEYYFQEYWYWVRDIVAPLKLWVRSANFVAPRDQEGFLVGSVACNPGACYPF
jgi:hypothetical protein